MREEPSIQLIELLEELDLATSAQIRAVSRSVRKLSKGVPLFELVWVDALAKAHTLTPLQASEINLGRGRRLKLGPFVLCRRLPSLGFAECYLARRMGTGEHVRLAVFNTQSDRTAEILDQLKQLVEKSKRLGSEYLAPIVDCGADADSKRHWVACHYVDGKTAHEWMVHNGRFPPEAVLEIGRQMLIGLTALEQSGLCHGDIRAECLVLSDDGRVVLPFPGLRGVVRPDEGYAHANLPPETYDGLAPERVSVGTRPNSVCDVYSVGCLCWHLLTGRSPISGGGGISKLRSAQTSRIPDVRPLAPDTPMPLVTLTAACVHREPNQRPESLSRLGAMLGIPTRNGRTALSQCLIHGFHHPVHLGGSLHKLRKSTQLPVWTVTTACCLLIAIAVTWSMSRSDTVPPCSQNSVSQLQHIDAAEVELIAIPSTTDTANTPVTESTATACVYQADEDLVKSLESNELVFSSEKPIAVESLTLRSGTTVRSSPGHRSTIIVPHAGLLVDMEDVLFENIDFVLDSDTCKPTDAIVRVHTSRVEFQNCSFQSTTQTTAHPVAISWRHPIAQKASTLSLPSGQIQLTNCVFLSVTTAIDCQTVGAVSIDVNNVLHLGSGALVQLDHFPKADEPFTLGAARVTLRDSGPLVCCFFDRMSASPGTISIRATDCTLSPNRSAALLCFVGVDSPESFLRNVQWTGQGSLVVPDVSITEWQTPNGKSRTLDDSPISIAGLVCSEVDFAGPPSDSPAASHVTRWQAPLRSTDPPGIAPQQLPNVNSRR